jgi:hypothetical protein
VTTTLDAGSPAASTGGDTTGEREGLWRRHRATLAIVAGAVAAVVVVLLVGDRPPTSAPLDPDNPSANGARAVARVLDDEGVDVVVARGAEQLDDTELGAGATVVVTSTYLLGESTTRRLLDHLDGAALVVAEPDPLVVDALGLTTETWAVAPHEDREAGCADPLFDGLAVRVDQGTEYDTEIGCFAGEHGNLLAVPREGLTFLGAADLLTNDQVLRADNAAVALRLLGQQDRLVWYVPDAADLVGGDGVTLSTLLPRWIFPGLWVLGAAAVALLLWRARRLGPLVTEPLPVTVKAIETAHSRGRLYRKSGDRAHAARALRRAARASVAERLHLPRTTTADQVALVREVSRHLDRPREQVHALLADDGPVPLTDSDLIALANDLAALQREVRRP